MVSDFELLSRNVVGGNEVVEVSANYSADIFTNNGGDPGAFLGHLSLSGTAHFLYLGRDPAVNPLGTFPTELTDFGFSGILNGNTFEVKRNPANTSAGSTTILPTTFVPPITFEVSGSLEILRSTGFNGSPFLPAPPRTADVNPVPAPAPEPGTLALLGMGLVTIAGRTWRRRAMR